MSFISSYLLKKTSFSELPSIVRSVTARTIKESKEQMNVTTGVNWYYPDAKATLDIVDRVSNDCCRTIDSALILYKNFSGDGSKESKAL